MAGRFTLRDFPASFAEQLRVVVNPLFNPAAAPRFNIAPTQPIAVVRPLGLTDNRSRRRELVPMLWGLVPHWASEFPAAGGWFNARAESVFEKPSFHAAAKYRRCLIPADGFYQWRTTPDGKNPYLYERPSGEPFCFAGIWDHWTAADGSEREGAAILTVDREGKDAESTDRLPVILEPGCWDVWTQTPAEKVQSLKRLLMPPAEALLTSRLVSRAVNNVRNDSADCVLSPE